MGIAQDIKKNCFIAFIHSRLDSKNTIKDKSVRETFINENDKQSVEKKIEDLKQTIGNMFTIGKVQKQIDNNQSITLAKMYYNNYKNLLDISEEKVTRIIQFKDKPMQIEEDGYVIEPIIGLRLLSLYNQHYPNKAIAEEVDAKELIGKYVKALQGDSEFEYLPTFMITIANHIFKKYFNKKTVG